MSKIASRPNPSTIGDVANTTAAIGATLNRAINAGLADARIVARLAEVGGRPILVTPDQFGQLWLRDTEATDEGVKNLTGLTKLAYLDLINTTISDSGLAELRQMKNLRTLLLGGTRVTEAGVKAFLEVHPKVDIRR